MLNRCSTCFSAACFQTAGQSPWVQKIHHDFISTPSCLQGSGAIFHRMCNITPVPSTLWDFSIYKIGWLSVGTNICTNMAEARCCDGGVVENHGVWQVDTIELRLQTVSELNTLVNLGLSETHLPWWSMTRDL